MKEFWDERYARAEYVYGESPNAFFAEQIKKLPLGNLLLPAEGEGRNAVFAAQLGWQVLAFDISAEARKKAVALAASRNVEIDYKIARSDELFFEQNKFDAAALIFAHAPSSERRLLHKAIAQSLRSGGTVVLEGFSKNHLRHSSANPNAGGPKDADMLYSLDELLSDFHAFRTLVLEETETELHEGIFHNGKSSVIRFVGVKK